MTQSAVVGGGIAGMTAAWELARAGHDVVLFESSDRLGGALAPLVLGEGLASGAKAPRPARGAGVSIDAGAEAFATRSPAVREFVEELGLADDLADPHPAGAWLQLSHTVGPLPATGILGVPADPQAEDVRALIGEAAAARAAEDLTAPMAWSSEDRPSVGAVVRDRMGDALADTLVAPITAGVYSAGPDQLDLRTVAPGLFEAMIAEGSLARAVAAQKAKQASGGAAGAASPRPGDDAAQPKAGSAVQSLTGGIHTLVAALEPKLLKAGVRVERNRPISDLNELAGYDDVVLALDAPSAGRLVAGILNPAPLPSAFGGMGTAVPGSSASGLARWRVEDATRGVALVTLLLNAPQLDARPRGTGMLVSPHVTGIGAKAMTHVSAKWDWAREALAAELGESHHAVRLSYGRTDGSDGFGWGSSDAELEAQARRDVVALFGEDLPGGPVAEDQILEAQVVRWRRALPGTSPAQARSLQQVRAAVALHNRRAGRSRQPRLHLAGTWFAGTGLARVIPHARRVAAEIGRRSST
ncbi:protoporphyrinogen/coproporphyrinogen oxidase [Nesterenkonia populi]